MNSVGRVSSERAFISNFFFYFRVFSFEFESVRLKIFGKIFKNIKESWKIVKKKKLVQRNCVLIELKKFYYYVFVKNVKFSVNSFELYL